MTHSTRNNESILRTCPTQLFINGEFVDAADGSTFDVINPSDGTVIAAVAHAGSTDAARALDAAVAAQEGWAATPPRARGEILYRAYELITEHSDEIAYLMSAELGRALQDSRAEVTYGAEFFRWFSEEAVRLRGDYRVLPAGGGRVVSVQQPVGPVLAITPWNFPLAMGTRKLGPALAAGCTAVVKPASKTPLSMLYLAQLLVEAGVPRGVVNVIPGDADAAADLLADTRLRKFTFTGSTDVGQKLAARAAENSLKTSLELGGNAPFVVLSDADLDKAIDAVHVAKLRGCGQVCIAANRFIVHSSLYEEFCSRVAEVVRSARVGVGTDEDTIVGALSGDDQVEKVSELVEDALSRGATPVVGGSLDTLPEELPEAGSFYPPTLLTGVPRDARIAKEEIFGPVVAVYSVDSDEEAIDFANDTVFGLAGYVFSENLERALAAAEAIDAGMVAVNKGTLSDPSASFGGMKQSGIGREGGFDGIDEFLENKTIALPDAHF